MGYLSQRKNRERANLFLNLTVVLLSILTLVAFLDNGDNRLFYIINAYRFQYYLVSTLLILLSFFNTNYAKFFISIFLFVINYFAIASTTNIFFNANSDHSKESFNIFYQEEVKDLKKAVSVAHQSKSDFININNQNQYFYKENIFPYVAYGDISTEKSFILTSYQPQNFGKLRLSGSSYGSYISIKTEKTKFVLININFRNLPFNEQSTAFNNLEKFISSMDDPIIVVGDFGSPAWTKNFKKFLIKTNLEVKNRIILGEGANRFVPYNIPSINILGYKNLDINDINFLSSREIHQPILFKISSD